MAENEKAKSEKQEDNVSETSTNGKNDKIPDFTINNEEMKENDEETGDADESDDITYTHPIVTEKKGYFDLTDFRRNYQDMEARANIKQLKDQTTPEPTEPVVSHDDPLEKRENGTIVSEAVTADNDAERKYVDEPEVTSPQMIEKSENDKGDISTDWTKENESVPIESTVRKTVDSENDSDPIELSDISPEEAYLRHIERLIATNALPPRNMEILKDLYASYGLDKTQTTIPAETLTETDIDTSELGESKTEKESMHDVKTILDPSLEDFNKVVQSGALEVNKISIRDELSSSMDDKLGSLEDTNSFANNDEILTSTPKACNGKLDTPSDFKGMENIQCDVNSLTIENPFSDFSLQTLKLKTGLGSISIAKNRTSKREMPHSSRGNPNLDIPGTSNNLYRNNPNDNLIPNSNLSTESYEAFVRDFLVCKCPMSQADTADDCNDTETILNRIRRHFLSLLIEYSVPRKVPIIQSKISRYF